MGLQDELRLLEGVGHILAPISLALCLIVQRRDAVDTSCLGIVELNRTLLSVLGLAAECYNVAHPIHIAGDADDVDFGLGALSWACLLAGLAWGVSRRSSLRRAVFVWCCVELLCSIPRGILIVSQLASDPLSGLRLALLLCPFVCCIFIAVSALIFSEASLMDTLGEEELARDEHGGVSEDNLHEKVNPLSQLLLRWLTPMMAVSRLRPLLLRDVSCVPPDADPSALAEEFNSLWEPYNDGSRLSASIDPAESAAMFRSALRKQFGFSVAILWVGRVLCTALCLSTTIFLELLLKHISDCERGLDGGAKVGGSYAAGVGLSMMWWAIMMGQYEYYISVEGLKARAVLSYAVWRRTLESLPGDATIYACKAVSGVSYEDSDTASAFLVYCGEVICFPFSAVAVALLLCRQVNYIAALMGVAVALLGTIPMLLLSRRMAAEARRGASYREARLAAMREMVAGSAVLKSLGWERGFLERLRVLRRAETRHSAVSKRLRMFSEGISFCTYPLSTLAVVAVHVALVGGEVKVENLFTALALLGILCRSVRILPTDVERVSAGWRALKSVEAYVCALSRRDDAHTRAARVGHLPTLHTHVLEMSGAAFGWPIREQEDAARAAWGFLESPKLDRTPSRALWTVVRSCDLKLKRGARALLFGPCGKTTLLKGLLGEACVMQGTVRMHGSVWYVGHSPWVVEGTVRDNVLLGSELRESRMAQVLSVCALVQGSKTSCGKLSSSTHVRDGGAGLSLATRQKIVFARAIYNQRDLYLLDEPLSAVPEKERIAIIQSVLRGILRGRSVVIATNNERLIEELDVDHVLLLRGGEMQSCEGKEREQAIAEMAAAMRSIKEWDASTGVCGSADDDAVSTDSNLLSHAHTHKGGAQTHVGGAGQSKNQGFRGGAWALVRFVRVCGVWAVLGLIFCMIVAQLCVNGADLALYAWEGTSLSNSTSGTSNTSRLIALTNLMNGTLAGRPTQSHPVIASTAEHPTTVLFSFFSSVYKKIEQSNSHNSGVLFGLPAFGRSPQGTMQPYDVWIAMVGNKWLQVYVCAVGVCVFSGWVALVWALIREVSAARRIYDNVCERIALATMRALGGAGGVDGVLARLCADDSSIDDKLPTTLRNATRSLLSLLGCMATITVACPVSALAAAPLLLLCYHIHIRYSSTQHELRRLQQTQSSLHQSLLISTARGARDIRAAYAMDWFVSAHIARMRTQLGLSYTQSACRAWLRIRALLLCSLCVSSLAALAVFGGGGVDLGRVGLALCYGLSLGVFLDDCAEGLEVGGEACAQAAGVLELAMLETEDTSRPLKRPLSTLDERIQALSARNSIVSCCFCSFSASLKSIFTWWRYEGGERVRVGPGIAVEVRQGTDPVSFHNAGALWDGAAVRALDLSAKRGEWVGIVGARGGGKEAILAALTGMTEISEGRLTVYGKDIARIPLCTLRASIILVHSRPWLFAGTIRENLDLLGDAQGDWQLWAALQQCDFRDVIVSCGGLDKVLHEDGAPLSAHQRQRLCIARALLASELRGASVLVLDNILGTTDEQMENLIVGRHIGLDQAVFLVCEDTRMCSGVDRAVIVDRGSVKLVDANVLENLADAADARANVSSISGSEAARGRRSSEGTPDAKNEGKHNSRSNTSTPLSESLTKAAVAPVGMLWGGIKETGKVLKSVSKATGKVTHGGIKSVGKVMQGSGKVLANHVPGTKLFAKGASSPAVLCSTPANTPTSQAAQNESWTDAGPDQH